MKNRNLALALSLAFMVPALAGCAAMRTQMRTPVTSPNPQSPSVSVTDRAAEDRRDLIGDQQMRTTQSPARAARSPETTTQRAAHHDMDYTSELSVDHLAALIGLNDRDVNTTLGTGRTARGGTTNGRTYTHNLYGKDTDFDLEYDDQSRINQVVITLDKAEAERWQRELTARYGARVASGDAGYSWMADNTRVNWTETDGTVRIIFTGSTI